MDIQSKELSWSDFFSTILGLRTWNWFSFGKSESIYFKGVLYVFNSRFGIQYRYPLSYDAFL